MYRRYPQFKKKNAKETGPRGKAQRFTKTSIKKKKLGGLDLFHHDLFHNRHPTLAYSLRGSSPAMPNRYLAGDSEREPFWQLPTWHFANNTQPSRRHQSRYSDHSLPWYETGPHRLCSMTPGQKKTFTQRLLQPNALMGHASAVDPNAPSSPLVDPLPFTRPLKPSVYPQFSKKKNWSKRQWPNVSRRPV